MIFYFGYRDLRIFTNVLPFQASEQFADAGMLQFYHSTRVDTARSVGYKSFEDAGHMYCL